MGEKQINDPMELVGRLGEMSRVGFGYDLTDADKSALTEAAACIRDMVAQKAAMQARLDRWEPRAVTTPMLPVGEHKRCNKILAALGQAYPRTCFVCRLGPCRDEITPHNLPPAPGAEDE